MLVHIAAQRTKKEDVGKCYRHICKKCYAIVIVYNSFAQKGEVNELAKIATQFFPIVATSKISFAEVQSFLERKQRKDKTEMKILDEDLNYYLDVKSYKKFRNKAEK